MNLRLYMRGLGLGILVTAIILIWSDNGNDAVAMSDAEIRDRARALGMTEKAVLSQVLPQELPSPASSASPSPTPVPSSTSIPNPPPMPSPSLDFDIVRDTEPIPVGQDEDVVIPDNEPEPTPPPSTLEPGTVVTIRINSGDDSFRVSSRLADAGLVPSASEYNRYLMDNGHSRRLRVGSFDIPSDADFEAIALIITGR